MHTHSLLPLLSLLALCDAPAGPHRGDYAKVDPSEALGALADLTGELPGVIAPSCPTLRTVSLPAGPRIVDPQDAYAPITITMQSSPDDPGYLCGLSCSLATTDCWVSASSDCSGTVDIPAQFPVTLDTATGFYTSSLTVCVQPTGASKIPLLETVQVITSNDPTTPSTYTVRGPS